METNLMDFWSRYAARLAEPPPELPARQTSLKGVPGGLKASPGMIASVAAPLSAREIERVKEHERYLNWARKGNHRPMNSERVYQRAVCCGRSHVRWRWPDKPFRITGQTCPWCEKLINWK